MEKQPEMLHLWAAPCPLWVDAVEKKGDFSKGSGFVELTARGPGLRSSVSLKSRSKLSLDPFRPSDLAFHRKVFRRDRAYGCFPRATFEVQ